MRALGVGIEDMRAYQANRSRGHEAAAEQRDLLLRHARRIEAEIAAQYTRLDYLREKAALWDARARGDATAEAAAKQRVTQALERMDMESSDEPSSGHRRVRLPGNATGRRAHPCHDRRCAPVTAG
jgi:DNA-binding transcriptional MerR regulator